MSRTRAPQDVDNPSKELVTPGTIICASNGTEAGSGVAEFGEQLVATVLGHVHRSNNTIRVDAINSGLGKVEKGDVVIGEVVRLNNSSVEIRILQIEGSTATGIIPQFEYGEIAVHEIVDRFLPEPRNSMRKRDILRAKVIDTDPIVRLSTKKGGELGVLHAQCTNCGFPLDAEGHGDFNVVCHPCKLREFRNLSDGFGHGYALSSDEEISRLNNSGKRWAANVEAEWAASRRERGIQLRNDSPRDAFDPACRLFVGNLPKTAETSDLNDHFSVVGVVADAFAVRDKDTREPRGFGFVTMSSPEEAKRAIGHLNGKEMQGSKIRVRPAGDDKKGKGNQRGGGKRKFDPACKIFVGNLAHAAETTDLHKHFSQIGTVIDAIAMKDRDSGRSRGFGFVTFETPENASKAIEKLHRSKILGRPVNVQPSGQKGGNKKIGLGTDRSKERKSKRELQAMLEEGSISRNEFESRLNE